MTPAFASLWLPIAVATLAVFFASSLVHMLLKWHNADYRKHPDEDRVRAAIGQQPPGQYVIPHCADMKDVQSPAMQQKFAEGPVAWVFIRRSGKPSMGPMLGQWFALCAAISVLVGYIASTSPGHVAGATAVAAFLAYGAGSVSAAIWMGRSWPSASKDLLDAAIYAAVTSASFALLMPLG